MSPHKKHHDDVGITKTLICYRLAGQVAMLFLLVRALYRIQVAMAEKLPLHPELQEFDDLGCRYATVWNIVIQFVYIILALTIDVTELLNKKSIVPEQLRRYRYTLFSGLLYPVGMSVVVIFWPHYINDRELIFPKKADLLMTFFDNFTCHGLVSVYAFYEMCFLPRVNQKQESTYKYVFVFNASYISVMYYSRYVDLGIWPYAIFQHLDGTLMFYVVLLSPLASTTFFYLTERWARNAIWKIRDSRQKDVKANNKE